MPLNDETQPIAQYALAYLQQGWKLVMMDHGTKGPSHAGWNTASELVDTPEHAFRRLDTGPQNMGLVHEPSGTCAIDIDDEAWARAIFDEFGLDYDDIMDRGLRIRSHKPGRDKAVFRAPDLPLIKVNWPKQNPTRANDVFSVFELRAGPNQDVLPPSKHPDGHTYEWWAGRAPWDFEEVPALPDTMLQFWRALADRDSGVREAVQNACPWKPAVVGKRFVQKARAPSEHGDVIGAFNAANDVGDLLERNGYKRKGKRYLAPSSSTVIPGVVVLDGKCFSHHGSDVLADGYAHDAFDLLVTLTHGGDMSAAIKDAAQQLGIERNAPVADMVLDLDAMMAAQAARKAKGPVVDTSEERVQISDRSEHVEAFSAPESRMLTLPKHLLRPPGAFGRTVDWMLETAQYPQPELAVAATLMLYGTVLGQKVRNWSGLRTNLYLAAVAGTSAGKEHGRKCIRSLLHAAGMGDNLGGDKIASGAGVLQRLTTAPVSLFMQDEFGMKLAGWTGKKAPTHLRDIVELMLSLFGQAGEIVPGTERADAAKHKRVDIRYPCLGVYGTTTENIWDALSGDDVASGLLNRLLVVSSGPKPPPQRAALGAPPERLVDWVKAARGMHRGLLGLNDEAPIEVADSPMAETMFTQFLAEVNQRIASLERTPSRELLAPLWGRACEHAMKISLILACTRYDDAGALVAAAECGGLEIDLPSAQWAIEFVRFTLTHMEDMVATRVGDSDFDRLVQDAVRVIDSGGVRGRTPAELCRYSRPFKALKPQEQDQVIEAIKRREAAIWVRFTSIANRNRLSLVSTARAAEVAAWGGIAAVSS